MPIHLLKTPGIFLYSLFLFSPSHLQGNTNGNHDLRAHIYARRGEFCQVSIFAKLVCQPIGVQFFCFAKIRQMPNWFAKLLELLLESIWLMPRCFSNYIIQYCPSNLCSNFIKTMLSKPYIYINYDVNHYDRRCVVYVSTYVVCNQPSLR
jgi:hypothetical protein